MPTQRTRAATTFAETFPKIPALALHPVRCGKTNCRCARGEMHESWRLVWRDRTGRQRHKYVPLADVARVRAILDRRRKERRATRLALLVATGRLAGLARLCRELERLERQS